MKRYLIYSYTDPRSHEVFYVGKDTKYGKRAYAFGSHSGRCLRVIKKLKRFGMKPIVNIIQEFDQYEDIYNILNNAEIYWISEFRNRGCPLVNISNGSGGVSGLFGEKNPFFGKKHSKQTRERFSKMRKGNKQTEEEKEKKRMTIKNMIQSGKFGKCKKIMCIEDGLIFVSIKEAADYYHIHYPNVAACAQGTRKSARGKHFEYTR